MIMMEVLAEKHVKYVEKIHYLIFVMNVKIKGIQTTTWMIKGVNNNKERKREEETTRPTGHSRSPSARRRLRSPRPQTVRQCRAAARSLTQGSRGFLICNSSAAQAPAHWDSKGRR